MHTTTPRTVRTLIAAALTAVLLPAAPALAQTATPTPAPTPTATPTPAPARPQVTTSASTIDVGSTVDLTVRGTPGQAVDLLASSARASRP